MYRDIAAAYLWLAVFWTLGSWADFYLGISAYLGFLLGLTIALGIVARAFVRQRRRTETIARQKSTSPARAEVGPAVQA